MGWSNNTSSEIVWINLSAETVQGDVDFVVRVSEHRPVLISDETGRAAPVLASVLSYP